MPVKIIESAVDDESTIEDAINRWLEEQQDTIHIINISLTVSNAFKGSVYFYALVYYLPASAYVIGTLMETKSSQEQP